MITSASVPPAPERSAAGRRGRLLGFAFLAVIAAAAILLLLVGGGRGDISRLPVPSGPIGDGVNPEYSRSIIGLEQPIAVAVSPDVSYLYVIEDSAGGGVRKLDLEREVTVAVLEPLSIDTMPRRPMALAVDGRGNVFVVDRARATIDVYDSKDNWLGSLPRPVRGGSWAPLGVTAGSDGKVYVTNAADGGPLIVVYDEERRVVETLAEVVVNGVPVTYASVAVINGPQRTLLLADSTNGRLVALRGEGWAPAVYGNLSGPEEIAIPLGVAADADGRGWVSDASDHSVAAWDFSQTPARAVSRFGKAGSGQNEFLFPSGLTVHRNGVIYVADKKNGRVQIWTY